MKKIFRISDIILLILSIYSIHSCKKDKPTPPIITTTGVTEISNITATSGGEIINDGRGDIILQGICWGTGPIPSIRKNIALDSTEVDSFTCKITGLNPNTTYYVRAFATNPAGIGYGSPISFTTLPGKAPTVSTQAATNITMGSATINGIVNANGSTTKVIFYFEPINNIYLSNQGGIVTPIPDTYSGNTDQAVSANVGGLIPGETYGFQIVSVNEFGQRIGGRQGFTTLGGAPIAITHDATNITTTGATLNGTVKANSISAIVTFEYGISHTYGQIATAVPSPVTGSTNMGVTANIVGLSGGITYHFRVKAINEYWIGYGDDMTFIIPGETMAVTQTVTNVTMIGATLNGTVFANSLSTIATFEYGISTNYESSVAASPNELTGDGWVGVIANISGLNGITKYHYRIKAANATGTKFGNDLSFATLGQSGTVTDIDNNTYKTIEIGNQVWMAENLKTTKYSDGTEIPLTNTTAAWNELTTTSKAYCLYNDDINNKETYGALYTWPAAMNGAVSSTANPSGVQGVCPTSWHLPSDAEWTELKIYLGGDGIAGGKLKETGTTHWLSPNEGATNESGFTALPGGWRDSLGDFYSIGYYGAWWSASENSTSTACQQSVNNSQSGISGDCLNKNHGFSVRCLRDY